jgi:hypothetical protein
VADSKNPDIQKNDSTERWKKGRLSSLQILGWIGFPVISPVVNYSRFSSFLV